MDVWITVLFWNSRLRVRFIDWLNNRLNGRMNGTSASMGRNTSGKEQETSGAKIHKNVHYFCPLTSLQETSGAKDSQKCSLLLSVYKYRDNDSLYCICIVFLFGVNHNKYDSQK